MDLQELKNALSSYKKEEIIITTHAIQQAIFRNIDLEEIKENIINPIRLTQFKEQRSLNENEKKLDCYFVYSKTQCQRYVLVMKNKCIVCTVIKINRRWQHLFEKHNQ